MTDEYINGYRQGYMDGLNVKENFKYNMFGMDLGKVLDIISDYIRKEQKSEIAYVPVGFTFSWSKRKEINEFFESLNKQGFEVKKCR